jgi:hypothetical protein
MKNEGMAEVRPRWAALSKTLHPLRQQSPVTAKLGVSPVAIGEISDFPARHTLINSHPSVCRSAVGFAPENPPDLRVESGHPALGNDEIRSVRLPLTRRPTAATLSRTARRKTGVFRRPMREREASASRVHRPLGMNPGAPVSTTLLNRTFVATLSRISCMASSGRVDSSKFSRIRPGVTDVVRRAVPRCTAQASAT